MANDFMAITERQATAHQVIGQVSGGGETAQGRFAHYGMLGLDRRNHVGKGSQRVAQGVGALMGLLTLMKGQPLAYNKDNQEDKEPLFDAADTLRDSLRAFADMIPAIKPKHAIMREAALRGFSTATDLADYLVRRGLPFRDCHEIVGHAVKYGVETGKDLAEMSLEELRKFSDQIEQDVFAVLTLEGSVNARNHIGGTAPEQVRAAVVRGRALLENR